MADGNTEFVNLGWFSTNLSLNPLAWIESVTQQNSNEPVRYHQRSTMGARLVTLVTATTHLPSHRIWCRWWRCTCYGSTLLKGGGTSVFTKMSTLSSSSWLQEMLVVYPVQWTLCKMREKYQHSYQKQFWTQGVFCTWPKVLKWLQISFCSYCAWSCFENLCTVWCRQAPRY